VSSDRVPKIRQHLALKKRGEMIISAYRQNESRREREQFKSDLAYKSAEASLAPIDALAAQNTKMEREIAEQEAAIAYRQIRKKLVFESSPDFLKTAPRYVPDGASADEITRRCRAANEQFLSSNDLSQEDRKLLWFFFQVNPEADISQASTWYQAWEFISNVLAPVVPPAEQEYEEAQSVEHPESIEDAKPLNRDEQNIKDRQDAESLFAHELAPIWQQAIESLQDSSGVHMADPERKQVMHQWEKRNLNSRRPIPFTVHEIRKSAFQIFGEVIGLSQEERQSWAPDDANLSADEYRRKHGVYGYASRPFAVTATRTRE
jgi:hypothetical protein